MMRRTINLLLMLLFFFFLTFANTVDFDKVFKESARIEKQIKRTSFPKRTFLITDFGAKTDDEANPCHEAINQAILQCSLSGGGTVIVPKGTFYTGPITKEQCEFLSRRGSCFEILYRSKPLFSCCFNSLGRN